MNKNKWKRLYEEYKAKFIIEIREDGRLVAYFHARDENEVIAKINQWLYVCHYPIWKELYGGLLKEP